jgi:16S rRNA processing protein RimM
MPEPAPRRTKPQRAPDDGFVAVGRVLAPFGLKGELKVQPLTDNPRRIAPRARLYAGAQKVTVASVREAQGYTYVTFKGLRDRTSVEPLRHALLQVPESELPLLAEGEYYRYQLIGLRVVDRSGAELGVLEEIIETGVNDVYRVRGESGDLLLPALDDVIVSVDLAGKKMVVDPPPWR